MLAKVMFGAVSITIGDYRMIAAASKKAAIRSKPGVEPRKKSIPLLLTTQVYPNKIKIPTRTDAALAGRCSM